MDGIKLIPIEERLPDVLVDVLIVLVESIHNKPDTSFYDIGAYCGNNQWSHHYEGWGNYKISHWCPLPELPPLPPFVPIEAKIDPKEDALRKALLSFDLSSLLLSWPAENIEDK